MKKSELFYKLQEAVSPEEWDALSHDKELAISEFNRGVLLGWKNEEPEEGGDIQESQVSGLYTVLKEYLGKHLEDRPEGWKWIILSCIYLTFLKERPMHPIEKMGIREISENGKTVYECPGRFNDKNSVCNYCVCRRMSNYEITKRKMEKEFLKYDQEKMVRKFGLDQDEEGIYINFLGRTYRIGRKDGKAAWREDGSVAFQEAGYNEAMTIYDVLCDSKEGCCLSGEFVNMKSLSSVHGGSSTSLGGGLFSKAERFFDHKEEALRGACKKLGGTESGKGDVSYKIPMFDFLPVVFTFWNSDDEFPASLQLFTDKNMLEYMRYETTWFAFSHLLERLKEEMADSFYSESNISALEERALNIDSGKSIPKEHELIEV